MTTLRFIVFCVGAAASFSQTRNAIVDVQYSKILVPDPIAAGQVVTLIVRGLSAPDTRANAVPLPLELAGVSAIVEESSRGYRVRLPLLRIDTVPCGSGLIFVCDFTAVTVQIPTEIANLLTPLPGVPARSPRPVITLSDRGVPGFGTEFVLQRTAIHVLTHCDVIVQSIPAVGCLPAVTHADGSLVTGSSPARPGEELVIYAVGLGETAPVVPTGHAAGDSVRVVDEFFVRFSSDGTNGEQTVQDWPRPVFVGLVPGYVGLYQLNIRVPVELPSGGSDCAGTTGTNIVMTIASRSSLDRAHICAMPLVSDYRTPVL